MLQNARLSWHIRLQHTLTRYSHIALVNVFGSPPSCLRQTVCLSGSEAEGGVGVRACLHRSCTPRVGNLYSVKRTPDCPGGARYRVQVSRGTEGVAGPRSAVVHRSVPGRQCACLVPRPRGEVLVLGIVPTDPVPLGSHGGTPWQVGASKICFRLASSSRSSWSSALGSGFRPVGVRGSGRLGFGFRPAGARVPAGGWVSCTALRGRDET